MIDEKYIELIAAELSLKPEHVGAALRLLDGGATIPFVARYRKDAVGGMDEARLEAIFERSNYFVGLANRRKSMLDTLAKEDRLTEQVRDRIEGCTDRIVLEDLFLPFKAKRHTKAVVAEERGVAPLADFILKQLPGIQSTEEFAEAFIKTEKSVSSAEEALEGARYLLAERFVFDSEARALIRAKMLNEGVLIVRATKNAEGTKTKFEAYYDFSEPMAKIPSHRMLAILRGVKEGFLRADISIDDAQMFNGLLDLFLKDPSSPFGAHIRLAMNEAYVRHLRPAIENEVMEIARKRAEEEAIRVCRENARSILLAPPAGRINVVGVVASGKGVCQVAVVDGSGAPVEHVKLTWASVGKGAAAAGGGGDSEGAPTGGDGATTGAGSVEADGSVPVDAPAGGDTAAGADPGATLAALIEKHQAYAIAVSNGAGARELVKTLNAALAKFRGKPGRTAFTVLVNGMAASLYASSRIGKEEFPDLEEAVREAVSVARRLQDPMAELVKVEPRSIGVGQYQHDVNQKQLREGLNKTVVSCVSRVGVDLNAAGQAVLRYVNGLQAGAAQNLIEARTQRGGFKSRAELSEVGGVGPKIFEQCAGFLRITGGENPLDATAIHPEAYAVVEQIAQAANVPVAELVGNREALERVDFAALQSETYGPQALADIRAELLKPAQDPRGQFRPPRLREGAVALDQVQEGMETEGVVTNVTDFGAFVDIGVQQDGLVHLSELSNRFVKDPREVIKVGEVVKVKVLKVDKETPRISLSIKALFARPPRTRPAPRSRPPAARPAGDVQTPSPEGAEAPARPRRTAPRRPEPGRERRPAEAGAAAEGGGELRRPARRPRPETRGRDSDRDRESRPDRGGARPPRRAGAERETQKVLNYGNAAGPLNTLLADQLAALRDKLK